MGVRDIADEQFYMAEDNQIDCDKPGGTVRRTTVVLGMDGKTHGALQQFRLRHQSVLCLC